MHPQVRMFAVGTGRARSRALWPAWRCCCYQGLEGSPLPNDHAMDGNTFLSRAVIDTGAPRRPILDAWVTRVRSNEPWRIDLYGHWQGLWHRQACAFLDQLLRADEGNVLHHWAQRGGKDDPHPHPRHASGTKRRNGHDRRPRRHEGRR